MIGMTTAAFFMKIVPYVIGMRVFGGLIDIGVHAAKIKIGKLKG